MRSSPIIAFAIFSIILLVIDFITYKGLKSIGTKFLTSRVFKLTYWSVPIVIILSFILFSVLRTSIQPASFFPYFHTISGFFILMYVPKLFFLAFEFMQWIYLLVKHIIMKIEHRGPIDTKSEQISRSQFLRKVGVGVAAIPFASIAYGILWGRFNFIVRKVPMTFSSLPKEFNGLKVAQITDFHLGSFIDHKEKVKEVVDLINSEKPDIILFTGDFVNNVAAEAKPFVPILKKLEARIGKYSVFGNHDYGDYVPWQSEEEKNANLEKLKTYQSEIGFRVLMDETITIERNGRSIDLVGVQNWGLPPFPQYGNLEKALSASNDDTFQILMSHDPTHWDEEVLGKTKVDLTLSGHTHGAQFGVEIPGWRWSPVNMRYKRWGGLYTEGKQNLFVSTGIGFIGFPGRVGISPEIVLFELKSDLI